MSGNVPKIPTYFRLDEPLKKILERIARLEHRTISKQLEKYVSDGILEDLEHFPEVKDSDDFDRYLRSKRGY